MFILVMIKCLFLGIAVNTGDYVLLLASEAQNFVTFYFVFVALDNVILQ